jgi:two-component system CheB/CheR fusion protein
LTQIIQNLLTNAAKFTNDGGEISLSARREGNEVIISVEDNEIGIPRRMLSKIFELFMREERAFGKSSSGLGIGLALVSQLVSLHGGTITAFSDGPGQGSKFVLRLPSIDTQAAPASVAKQTPDAGTGRVLVVDDNVDSADAIAMLLGLYGYEVRKAYDSATGISEASSFVPHVALLDLSRPEPDGLRIASLLQQMEKTKKTVLIAVSGYGQPDDLERTRKAGFAHHLVKPVEPEMIHKLIKSIISDEVKDAPEKS